MSAEDDFAVDTDELDLVVSDLEKCEGALESLLDDLTTQVRAMHGSWEGLTRDAHAAAHEEWSGGMRAMRQAMVELRVAARAAHGHYTAAADANVSMWEEMR
jgi:WXG100 family type VII secretion target